MCQISIDICTKKKLKEVEGVEENVGKSKGSKGSKER
jgi:hypothetical protein